MILYVLVQGNTRRGDTIVQNQMFAQANRGHRTNPRAQTGGTIHLHHPPPPRDLLSKPYVENQDDPPIPPK